jgi:hypothetical protein
MKPKQAPISRRVYNAAARLNGDGTFTVVGVLYEVNRDFTQPTVTIMQVQSALQTMAHNGILETAGAIGRYRWSE